APLRVPGCYQLTPAAGALSSYPDRRLSRFQTSPTLKPQGEDSLCAIRSSTAPAQGNTVHRSASHSSHTCPNTANPEQSHRLESCECETPRPYPESAVGLSTAPCTAKNRMPIEAAWEQHRSSGDTRQSPDSAPARRRNSSPPLRRHQNETP